MAIDTAAKRYSALNVLSPWRGLNYFPTGVVGQAERQAVLRLYSGILAVAPVSVPNVVGETQAQATTDITGAGLVLGTVSTANSSTVAAGLVISQSPTAGSLVSLGSAVSIVVSLGPLVIAAEAPAGSRRPVRNIYRIRVDGQPFEFPNLAAAIEFLDQAKRTATQLAAKVTREATEIQRGTPLTVAPPKLDIPKITVSSRELRGAVTETKREIAAIYERAIRDAEIAMLLELDEREKHNETLIWFF